jgi:hypothetical protein
MNNWPHNEGKPWSQRDLEDLLRYIRENTPTRVAALKLGRTEASVYSKAQQINASLKPTNQSPYNRLTRR